MERYDQHVHSAYSFDSRERPEEQCEAAVRQGLRGLTFTEHFSVDPLDVSYGVLRYDAYRRTVRECQEKYAGQLEIGCGLEIGEPHLEKCKAELIKSMKEMELDLVIGSVHNIESVKLRDFQRGKGKAEVYAAYFQEMHAMAKTADIDVIGHLDLVKRYAFDVFGNYAFDTYRDQIAEILKTAVDRGLGIEINTSGWRNAVGVSYPSPEVMKLYHDLGGVYVTIGSDAHEKENLGDGWSQALGILKEAGFRQYFCYRKRKPYPVTFDA